MLDYSIVIATRNRPAALRLSIPRMLTQTRLPSQLIVVDSSDDHEAVVAVVKACTEGHRIDWIIVNSERGLTRQRNIGLTHVTQPVVFFPDDDSIWFSDTAEAQLVVYERDHEEKIAAVCAAESPVPPPDWQIHAGPAYKMRTSHRVQQRFGAFRTRLETKFLPDPAKLLGRSFWPPRTQIPDWFDSQNVVFVEWMTGFRMSFRTSVARKIGFDENLSRYSLFEDIDASFGAWQLGWVVGARKGKVYHYRSPENRDDGRRLGAGQLLNKAYVVTKHSAYNHDARKFLLRYAFYKLVQYSIGAGNQYGRQRLGGACAAMMRISQFVDVNPDNVSQTYGEALSQCLDVP
jgi:glycosyltransferase involved in cell wall biosynthesis